MFYTYLYKDIDGRPVYVGKGKNRRVYRHIKLKTHLGNLLRKRLNEGNKIEPEIYYCSSEKEAFELEESLIKSYGREDLKTGTLFNLTNGGEGDSGAKRTPEMNKASSERSKARNARPPSRLGCKLTEEQLKFASIRLSGLVKKKPTKEMNKANSDRQKGIPQRKLECPYCGKFAGISNMKGKHIPKCEKLNKVNI